MIRAYKRRSKCSLHAQLVVLVVCALIACDDKPTQPAAIAPGTVLWKAPGFFATGQPALDAASVYALDTESVVRALRRVDGRMIWRQAVKHGSEQFPRTVVLASGTVVVGRDDLIGLDATTGTQRWKFSHAAQPGVLWLAADDSTVYAGSYRARGELFGVRATDGVLRWSTFVYPADSVLAAADDVRLLGPAHQAGTVVTSFVRLHRNSFVHRGGVAAVDANTGNVLWSRLLPVPLADRSTFPSVVALSEGMVVVSAEDGYVYGLNHSDGSVRWMVPPIAKTDGSPNSPDERIVGTNGSVVIATSGATNVISGHDAADGHLLWRARPRAGSIRGLLVIDQQLLICHHATGQLSAFDMRSGAVLWQIDMADQGIGLIDSQLRGDILYVVGTEGVWAIKAR